MFAVPVGVKNNLNKKTNKLLSVFLIDHTKNHKIA